jgi:DNA-binding MarR family transcriptional regulator
MHRQTEKKPLHELGLTRLETAFMEALIKLLFAEPGFSDVIPADIAKLTGEKRTVTNGVLGSLVKKGLVWTDASCGIEIIYLHSDYYHLHPKWSLEKID